MADIIYPGEEPLDTLGATKLPTNVDLAFWKGDVQEFFVDLTAANGTPVDLTGTTAQAVIRSNFTSSTTYSFQCTITGNRVRLYMPSSLTKTIPAGDYIWNFQLTTVSTSDVRTYLAGDVTVYAEVDP
jgi:hypothetical protein